MLLLRICTPDDITRVRMAMKTHLLAMAHNPNHLHESPAKPFLELQKSTSHGGKFWKAIALPEKLILSWGRLGSMGQNKDVFPEHCLHGNLVEELLARALKKLQEGYRLQG